MTRSKTFKSLTFAMATLSICFTVDLGSSLHAQGANQPGGVYQPGIGGTNQPGGSKSAPRRGKSARRGLSAR